MDRSEELANMLAVIYEIYDACNLPTSRKSCSPTRGGTG
jgi:hypothetical protein